MIRKPIYSFRVQYLHPDITSIIIRLINRFTNYDATLNNITATKHHKGCIEIRK